MNWMTGRWISKKSVNKLWMLRLRFIGLWVRVYWNLHIKFAWCMICEKWTDCWMWSSSPLTYEGIRITQVTAWYSDEHKVIIEIKQSKKFFRFIRHAMNLLKWVLPSGYLNNWNDPHVKAGIKRMVKNYKSIKTLRTLRLCGSESLPPGARTPRFLRYKRNFAYFAPCGSGIFTARTPRTPRFLLILKKTLLLAPLRLTNKN